MATLQGGLTDVGIDFYQWDLTPLQTGKVSIISGHEVSIQTGDHIYFLTGHHFTFETMNGDISLAAGTITGIDVYPYPLPPEASPVAHDFYKIGGIHLDVGKFNDFVADNNVSGFESALFSHNDQMVGTGAEDDMVGLRGNDHMQGLDGDDILDGGRGHDVLIGGTGGDRMTGGQGRDTFVYTSAADSGNGQYDTLVGFNPHFDHLIVPKAVTGIDASVDAGFATSFNIDPNLATALDADHLAAHHAALATVEIEVGPPDADSAMPSPPTFRETFLVIDLNGVAGFQSGEDLAIRIESPDHLRTLNAHDFISPAIGS